VRTVNETGRVSRMLPSLPRFWSSSASVRNRSATKKVLRWPKDKLNRRSQDHQVPLGVFVTGALTPPDTCFSIVSSSGVGCVFPALGESAGVPVEGVMADWRRCFMRCSWVVDMHASRAQTRFEQTPVGGVTVRSYRMEIAGRRSAPSALVLQGKHETGLAFSESGQGARP
jgi:hypothetical protein